MRPTDVAPPQPGVAAPVTRVDRSRRPAHCKQHGGWPLGSKAMVRMLQTRRYDTLSLEDKAKFRPARGPRRVTPYKNGASKLPISRLQWMTATPD